MATKLPLKDRRMSHGCTLVQVAAEAGCSIGFVQKYELRPDAEDGRPEDARKRQKLDENLLTLHKRGGVTKAMARRLRREHSARVGMLQFSKTFRKDLTEAYIADVNRPRLPAKVRDPQWAFQDAKAKQSPISLTET